MKRVICLAGPTGAGKTALSLAIANDIPCEIINADSRQVYRDFPIITAQPTLREQRELPHHFYGFLPSQDKISAGQWVELACKRISQIAAAGKIPLLVGGTGFYFEALLHGLAPMPEIAPEISEYLNAEMLKHGPENLHARLAKIDPDYAAKAHPHDRQRIQRALEIYEASGKSFTWWHKQGRLEPCATGPLLVLNSTLAELEPGLKTRIELMLEQGALAEAEKALTICADAAAPGWSGIGCREILAFLQKRISLPECKALWLAATRAYAKRQLTWFRGRREAIFVNNKDAAMAAIRQFQPGIVS